MEVTPMLHAIIMAWPEKTCNRQIIGSTRHKKKALLRTGRPLTIACHMKKVELFFRRISLGFQRINGSFSC